MFKRGAGAQMAGAVFTQRDQRADGGKRKVRVTRSDILISRRFAGISMKIAVPVSTYQGVALAIEAGSAGGAAYRLSLAHRDPDLTIVLAETQDSGLAAADWKYWATFLDLPRLAEDAGKTHAVDDPAPAAQQMRGRGVVAKRRPRFLARRKRGDLARIQTIFAGEREIVSYE